MFKNLCVIILAASLVLSGFSGYTNECTAKPLEAKHTQEVVSEPITDNVEVTDTNENTYCTTTITKTEIEHRLVLTGETTIVKISVDKKYTIDFYTYETSGFNVNPQLLEEDNQIIISLRAVERADKPIFTLHINLKDDISVKPSVYGFVNNNEVFLSPTSFDDAWSYYLESLISQQRITEKEAEQMRIEHNKPYVQEEIRTEHPPGPATRGVADTWVRGRLQWRDDKGDLHPLQYVALDVRDEDAIEDDILGTNIFTDENGNYVFGFENQTIATEQGGCDPYIMVYAIGIGLNVMVNNYYARSSTVQNVATGSTTYIDMTFTMDNDLGRAFQILQAAVTASRYVNEMNDTNVNLGLVRINYPDNGQGCYYDSETKNIFITGAPAADGMPQSYASWDVITHEYMHHIQTLYDITENPGLGHIINRSMIDHYAGTDHENCGCAQPEIAQAKYQGIRIAWAEAWPTVMGIMSQQYYKNTLQNISTVGDYFYTSYNRVDADLETVYWFEGEGCEGTICAVLYDLYDSINESFDHVDMGHKDFFNASINSKAKTLSEFVNYCYSNDIINPIYMGEILSKYGIAPSSFRATTSLTQTPPTFTWTVGNNQSSNYRNNSFKIVFYNEGGYEIFKTNEIKGTSYTATYTLTQSEWSQVLASYGNTFTAGVYGYQTSYPATGGYLSDLVKFTKPAASALEEEHNFDKNFRYYETTVSLQPGQYIDYYFRFASSGNITFQTFGTRDTYLYEYSARGALRKTDDDSGYGQNALICPYVMPDTTMIIRLKFSSPSEAGEVKLGVMNYGIESFEKISGPYKPGDIITEQTGIGVKLTRYNVQSAGNYSFYTDRVLEDSNYSDTYMYLIDPTSTQPCLYNDDGGGNSQAKITATLNSGIEYLVITSPFMMQTAASYKLYLTPAQ